MSTFKSWLVANIDVFIIIITILLFVSMIIHIGIEDYNNPDKVYSAAIAIYLLFGALMCTLFSLAIKNGLTGLIGLIFLLALYGGIAFSENPDMLQNDASYSIEDIRYGSIDVNIAAKALCQHALEKFQWAWLIWLSFPSLILGFITGRYANLNFEDVVSRRFLYKNSRVSIFEVKWKYTINRFWAGFMTLFFLGIEVIFIICFWPSW